VALACPVVGCTLTRPDQDNFEIDGSKGSIEQFVRTLSSNLDASLYKQDIKFPDADPSVQFELDAQNITVVISATPDDRCNPNAPWHATFKEGRYRADLVYRTSSKPIRVDARQKLIKSARQTGLPIQTFKEC
jgi:hypothetical protein